MISKSLESIFLEHLELEMPRAPGADVRSRIEAPIS